MTEMKDKSGWEEKQINTKRTTTMTEPQQLLHSTHNELNTLMLCTSDPANERAEIMCGMCVRNVEWKSEIV